MITLDALACESGESLATEQVEAASQAETLGALGKAASSLRGRLGESLASVARLDAPIGARDHLLARGAARLQPCRARARERQRVGLDPALQARDRARSELRAGARAARDGVQQRRRARAEPNPSHARVRAARPRDRAREALHQRALLLVDHRRDRQGARDLRAVEADLPPGLHALQQPFGALRAHRRRRTRPWPRRSRPSGSPPTTRSPSSTWASATSRTTGSTRRRACSATPKRAISSARWGAARSGWHTSSSDAAELARLTELSHGKPWEPDAQSILSTIAFLAGRMTESAQHLRAAASQARQQGLPERAAAMLLSLAWEQGISGMKREARETVVQARAALPRGAILPELAMGLALSGQTTEAESMAEALSRKSPVDTLMQQAYLPEVRAAVALERGQHARAIELLEAVRAARAGSLPHVAPAPRSRVSRRGPREGRRSGARAVPAAPRGAASSARSSRSAGSSWRGARRVGPPRRQPARLPGPARGLEGRRSRAGPSSSRPRPSTPSSASDRRIFVVRPWRAC